MRKGNLFKLRVTEIRVNKGVGVTEIISGRCRFGNECLNLHEGPIKVSGVTKKKRTAKVEKSPERSPDRSKMPMKTALDVIKRIQWDEMMPPESFTIGYLDRFTGLVEEVDEEAVEEVTEAEVVVVASCC